MKTKIGTKIYGGYAIALLLLIAIGLISYFNITKFIKDAEWIEQSNKTKNTISLVYLAIQDAETSERGYSLTGKESFLEPYDAAKDSAYKRIERLNKMVSDNPEQINNVSELKQLTDTEFYNLENAIEIRKNEGLNAVAEFINKEIGKKSMDNIRKSINNLTDSENTIFLKKAKQTKLTAKRTILTMEIGIPLVVIIIILVGFIITRSITDPLKDVTNIAESISEGDITVDIKNTGRTDEIGILSKSFSKMILYLKDMVKASEQVANGNLTIKIHPKSEKDSLGNSIIEMIKKNKDQIEKLQDGVNVLASSSSEILAATSQIASSSAETASSINETSVTVDEVGQAAELSMEKAKNVSENAENTAQVAKDGRTAVDILITKMNDIQVQMGSIANTIVSLSEQSQMIGSIISTVNDIADQSNLLAVNAAIEASKAGDHGKGFAVVADEIKSLALESKKATAQIRTILNDIQKATSVAVLATEQGSKAVKSGVSQSKLADESIAHLMESINKFVQSTTQIVASSRQQKVGMEQITLAMENIKQAGIDNATSSRQSERSAKDIHDLGIKLREIVEQYKI